MRFIKIFFKINKYQQRFTIILKQVQYIEQSVDYSQFYICIRYDVRSFSTAIKNMLNHNSEDLLFLSGKYKKYLNQCKVGETI